MVFTDPDVSSTVYTVFQTMINRGLLRQSYIDELAKQDLKFVPSHFDLARTLSMGEAWIGQGSDVNAAPAAAEGAPIRAVPMKEGNLYWGMAIELIKDSPHPNAARVFTNWILSQDGARLSSDLLKAPSVRNDMPNPMPKSIRFEGKVVALTAAEVKTSNDSFSKKQWVSLFKKSK